MKTHRLHRAAARLAAACRAALLPAALLLPTVAPADTLTLHNGDRLTGRILHMSPSTLTFETTWAGEMRIPRYEIRSIETDKPVSVLRERASHTETATLGAAEAGSVVLSPERAEPGANGDAVTQGDGPAAAGTTLPIARLRYLNPKPEESGEGASFAGRVTLSGTLARGNTETDRAYAEGDFGVRARDWRAALAAKALQEHGAAGTSASNWLVSGTLDRLLDDDAFVYTRASAERDRFRDIGSRLTLGGGYGRQLLETGRSTLSVRGGLELVDLHRIGGADETAPALGWGLNFTHRMDTLSAELFHDHQGFRTLDDARQTTLRSRSGVRVPFKSGLTASLQVNHAWDSEPAPGRSGLDTTWLLGLGYAW